MAELITDKYGFKYYNELPPTAQKVNLSQFKKHIEEKQYYILHNKRTEEYELYKHNGEISKDLKWFIENGCVYLSKKKKD